MINITEKSRLDQIRNLVWRQAWAEADAECQALLDDPQLSPEARAEVQAILREIEEKLHAEQTIREALTVAETELQKPLPDFEDLRRKLEHAQHLEQQYYLLQWRSELQNCMNDLLRRKDQGVRLEEDRRVFKQSLDRGDYDRAFKIARDLLADAEIMQQPALAESARQWLQQVGTQLHFDDLAESVEQALERQDYEWAIRVFAQLPAYAQRTLDLRPRVVDAEVSLKYLRDDMAEVKEAWEAGQIEEAKRVLRDLRRDHPRNSQWKRLWIEFYSDVALHFGREGDVAIAAGDFAEALRAYKAQLEALQAFLDVDPEDMGVRTQKEVTQLYVEITTALSEAQAAMQHRADINTAQVLCGKAEQQVQDAPHELADALPMLRQRVLDFQQQLHEQEAALQLLEKVEALPPDSDLEVVRQQLTVLEDLSSSLPEVAQKRIQGVRSKMEERQAELGELLRRARASIADPEAAFAEYYRAWQVARNANLQDEIVAFCLEQAQRASDDAARRVWLEHGEQIVPQNPAIQQGMLALSLRPDFDRDFLPLKSQLAKWYDSPETDPLALKTLQLELESLLRRFGKVDELRRLLEKVLADCKMLAEAWERLTATLKQAERLQGRGEWLEAIEFLKAFLKQQSIEAEINGVQRRLHDTVASLENRYQEAMQAHIQAEAFYRDALDAYKNTVETHDYDLPLRLLAQAEEQQLSAFQRLDNAPPVSWKQLQDDLRVLRDRVKMLQQTWSERFKPDSLVVHVLQLRDTLQGQPEEPVAQQLLQELEQQAIADLLEKARQAEREELDARAQEALEQALKLGAAPDKIDPWLAAVRSRDGHRKRIKELRLEVEKNLERSGSLREAALAQERLLQELVADTGDETLREKITSLLTQAREAGQAPLDLARKIQEQRASADEQKGLESARNAYLAALGKIGTSLEELKQQYGVAGGAMGHLLDEAEKWLRLNRQALFDNAAKSAAQLGDYIFALKNLQQMQQLAPDSRIYESEITETREKILEQLRTSAKKRLTEARTANAQESFASALGSLTSIEAEFYKPIWDAFLDLKPRLTEPGTPEGSLLTQVQEEIGRTTRLKDVAGRLENWLSMVQGKRREDPAAALALLEEVPSEASSEDFPIFFKRVAVIKQQIRTSLQERRKEAAVGAIRRLEIALDSVPVQADYKVFQEQLSEIDADVLEQEYKDRYETLRKRVAEYLLVPGILKKGDLAWEQGNYSTAGEHYRRALEFQPRLQYDPDFMQQLRQATERVQTKAQAHKLIEEGEQQIFTEPQAAIKTLEQARTIARQQGAQEQEEEIQRLIYRAYAAWRFQEAESAFNAGDVETARYKAEAALEHATASGNPIIRDDVELFIKESITPQLERKTQARKSLGRARQLMDQCEWDVALAEIAQLPSTESNELRQEIERRRTEARQIEVQVKELIREGNFQKAEATLREARMGLILSETAAQMLREALSAAQEQMKGWRQEFTLLLHSLGAGDPLSVHDLSEFIEKAKVLAVDPSAVQGLRDEAEKLAQVLQSFKVDFEKTEKQLRAIKNQSTSKALEELAKLRVQYSLEVGAAAFQLTHVKVEDIRILRKDLITSYLADLQSYVEAADEHPLETLQVKLDEAKTIRQYLDHDAGDLGTFDKLYAQLEMAWQRKDNERSAEAWEARLEAIRERKDVDSPAQLVDELKKLVAEIEQRCHTTPRDTWGNLRSVSLNVSRLQKEIENDLSRHVSEVKKEAFGASRSAIHAGQQAQLEAARDKLGGLLKDPHFSATDRAEVEEEIKRVERALEDYEQSEAQLNEVTQLLETLNYKQARVILNKPLPAPALRDTWVALGKVVAVLEAVEALFERAKNWGLPEEWRAGAQECEAQVRDCEDLLQNWPENLASSDSVGRTLRREIERVLPQLRALLASALYQQALIALHDELPDEAISLKTRAEEQGWAVGEYAQRFRNLGQEIEVVRAMIALEGALLASEWDRRAQNQLETRLGESYILDPERRKRARALLKLAEIRTLLKDGAVDEAALRIGDGDLTALRPFNAISREVETAKTELKKVKGLCRSLDMLKLDVLEGNWRADVEEAQSFAQQGNMLIIRSLKSLERRVTEELKALHAQGDYERLAALNPLARQLQLSDLDVVALRGERDERFKSEYAEARKLLSQDLPEEADPHVKLAERLGTGAQEKDLRALEEELEARRSACREADVLMSEVQLELSQGNYEAAARKYLEACEKAPRRTAVTAFAKRAHGEWWQTFESFLGEAAFPRAEALAKRALQFGFEKRQWEEALAALRVRRQQYLTTLLESLAGPGYGEQDGKLVITGGLLANPDADLEPAWKSLGQARSWFTESPIDVEDEGNIALRGLLDPAWRELEARIQLRSEARLDMRQGWDALDRGEFQTARTCFKAAHQRLDFKHLEVSQWCSFVDLLLQVREALPAIQRYAENEGLIVKLHERFVVQCPGWEEVERCVNDLQHGFSALAPSTLLGTEGQEYQRKVRHWVEQWSSYVKRVSGGLAAMQRFYDDGITYYDRAGEEFQQVLAALKELRQTLEGGVHELSKVMISEPALAPAPFPPPKALVPELPDLPPEEMTTGFEEVPPTTPESAKPDAASRAPEQEIPAPPQEGKMPEPGLEGKTEAETGAEPEPSKIVTAEVFQPLPEEIPSPIKPVPERPVSSSLTGPIPEPERPTEAEEADFF